MTNKLIFVLNQETKIEFEFLGSISHLYFRTELTITTEHFIQNLERLNNDFEEDFDLKIDSLLKTLNSCKVVILWVGWNKEIEYLPNKYQSRKLTISVSNLDYKKYITNKKSKKYQTNWIELNVIEIDKDLKLSCSIIIPKQWLLNALLNYEK